jgi:prepilin-type N-terminal cleavage/methylation domain-containing protein
MSLKNPSKANKGFTIIEVLIVLAIAGLILLIVFLAVPALQRNSRNTSAKNDVQNVVGGVSEYQGANNGSMPNRIAAANGTVTYDHSTSATENATTIQVQGTTVVSSVLTAPAAATPAAGTIVVSIGFRCDGAPSSRAIAAVYSIETTATNPVRQCIDS